MPTHNGIVLGPNSPALSQRGARSEKAEQQLCDDLISRIAGKEHIVNLSQTRASMITVGVPDRRYRVYGVGLWWETKPEDGKLTAEQHAFLLSELRHGALGGVGTLEDLQRMLVPLQALHSARDSHTRADAIAHAAMHCLTLVGQWAARGYRRERQPSKRSVR